MAPGRTRPTWTAALATIAVALATMPTGPADAAPPAATLHNVGGATAVPESWIVVLRDTAAGRATVTAGAAALAEAYGATVRDVWADALHGFSARMSERAAAPASTSTPRG